MPEDELHAIAFTFDDAGNLIWVYHPNDELAQVAINAVSEVLNDCRAGHVWPAKVPKRWLFRALRKVFGGKGTIASWTRRWRGLWVVVDAASGLRLPGLYLTHASAVQAEVRWSLAHGEPRAVLG